MTAIDPLATLYKATWSGTLGTEEIFAYSRWVTGTTPNDQETIIDGLTDDVTNMLAQTVSLGPVAAIQQCFPEWVVWTELKLSPWDHATDKLVAGQTPAYRPLTDAGVDAGTPGLPFQCALAMTTRSALSGRRKYNRFYLPPMTAQSTDGQGDIDPTIADALALWWHLSMTSHAALSEPIVYCHYTRSIPGPWTYPILDLYLGHRIDTIRRRRNKATEARTIDTM